MTVRYNVRLAIRKRCDFLKHATSQMFHPDLTVIMIMIMTEHRRLSEVAQDCMSLFGQEYELNSSLTLKQAQ